MRIALITGITGQDGSYLAEILLEKEYLVFGIVRRSSDFNTKRIDHLYNNNNLKLRYGDLTDMGSIISILSEIKQNYEFDRLEVYNLGAMSHVKVSFEMPEYTADTDALGTLRLLEAIRALGIHDKVKYYQASTSELYGKVVETPQNENTPFYPRSPYGVAKLYAYWITKNYREAYGMFACNGILFNHESPRRGPTFISRKVTIALGNILSGKQESLTVGNLNAKRDWGHARDFCYGMWLMLQADKPEDYVLSTGTQYSVRHFIELAFGMKGFDICWRGQDENEVGYDKNTGRELVFVSPKYFRPAEVETLLGDSSKAKQELGWEPKYSFEDLVREMVEHDAKN